MQSHSLTSWSHLQLQQELGLTWMPSRKRKIGSTSHLASKIARLYSVRNDGVFNLDHHPSSQGSSNKAILNLTFSPCGDTVAAATSGKSILLFDPLCHKLIHHCPSAHAKSVNCVKFIDDNLFASGSDDAIVTLWDRRMLRSQVKQISRYPSAVKNLEYHSQGRSLIVTTADFDGSVYICPLNGDTYQSVSSQDTLHLSCVTKCVVSEDSSKLIFATSEGYMMVVHDLNLDKLTADLAGFRPDLYRLMQCGNSCGFDFGSWFNYLFTAKRNRIELISDFAPQNDAHVITSLSVHPKTWTVLSRNISRSDTSEWTCVHNIQDHVRPYQSMPILLPKDSIVHSYSSKRRRGQVNNESALSMTNAFNCNSTRQFTPAPSYTSSFNSFPEMNMNTVVIISSRSLDQRAHATILTPNTSYRSLQPDTVPPRIYTNLKRLLYHIPEEKGETLSRSYFKECAFSHDGRLISSPHKNGFRLLAFDEQVNEISVASKSRARNNVPSKLEQVATLNPHEHPVLLSKFSPTHNLIASACQGGRVAFSHPSLG